MLTCYQVTCLNTSLPVTRSTHLLLYHCTAVMCDYLLHSNILHQHKIRISFLVFSAMTPEGHEMVDRDISTCRTLEQNSSTLTYAYQTNTTTLSQQVQGYHLALHLSSAGSCMELTVFTFQGDNICDKATLCEALNNQTVSSLCHFNCTCTSEICFYGVIELQYYSISVCEMYFIIDE